MKALIRDRYGPPDVLEVRNDVPVPVPEAGEVLVRVHAASINDWDLGLLQGPTLPFLRSPPKPILGSDVAGHIVRLGPGSHRFRVGDAVYGDLSRFGTRGWGGFAEYVCAPEHALVRKPARMTFVQAAALPQAGQLAVQGLSAAGPLKAGQKVLINGAGGGVGTIGVQIAKAQGAEVSGVDRAVKLDMMRSIGFDHVIDYEKEDFTNSGKRYDLIVDTRTTHPPADYLRALNPGGTYASVGGPEMKVLFRVLTAGLKMRFRSDKRLRLIGLRANRDLRYLNGQFEAGHLVPVIDGPYALNHGADAFRHYGSGNFKGKVVITIDDAHC
jgi:NADPH:quinone reductase-like Zn-dependent oxidoreductase